MTEAEAKTKWCPFARPGQVRPDDCGEVRGNRMMQGEVDGGSLCIASACMAWRVDRHAKPTMAEVARDKYGFCGLASPSHSQPQA